MSLRYRTITGEGLTAQLAQLEAAHLALVGGKQVVEVRTGDKSVKYTAASIDHLERAIKALQAQIDGKPAYAPVIPRVGF